MVAVFQLLTHHTLTALPPPKFENALLHFEPRPFNLAHKEQGFALIPLSRMFIEEFP
jgi:hypothetical protein